jgi:hypothetical protein
MTLNTPTNRQTGSTKYQQGQPAKHTRFFFQTFKKIFCKKKISTEPGTNSMTPNTWASRNKHSGGNTPNTRVAEHIETSHPAQG